MALVDPECFPGLSPEERRQQLYEALYGLVDDDSLTDPACFLGQSRIAQEADLFSAWLALQNVAPPSDSFFLQPDGSSFYLQPDGVSLYLRP